MHEEVLVGAVAEVSGRFSTEKGEITLLIAPDEDGAQMHDAQEIDSRLRDALVRVPAGKAASEVAKSLGLKRNELYKRALALKEELEADE